VSDPIRVGDIVHGHLDGHFGRDHYECGRVEAIGADWVIVRTFDGVAVAGLDAIPGRVTTELVRSRDRDPDQEEHSFRCPKAVP